MFVSPMVVPHALAQTVPAAEQSSDAIDRAADAIEKLEQAISRNQGQKQRLRRLAGTLARELREIQDQLVKSARTTQKNEKTLARVEARLAELEAREQRLVLEFRGKRQSLGALASGLQRMARRPPEAVLMGPGPPVQSVRTAILLEYAIPRVNERADQLRREINTVVALRGEIRQEQARLEEATAVLENERTRLASLATEKADLYRQLRGKSAEIDEKVTDLGRSARNIRQLLSGLKTTQANRDASVERLTELTESEKDQKQNRVAALIPQPGNSPGTDADAGANSSDQGLLAVPESRSFAEFRGTLRTPANGKVIRSYGSRISKGRTARGLTIETRPMAQVVTPFDGKVLYAGVFRGYGPIIIIDHGDSYVTLLAGLGQLQTRVGQNLLAGEPVGTMSSETTGESLVQGERATGSETAGAPRLYVELRHQGIPVNPESWIVTSEKKG